MESPQTDHFDFDREVYLRSVARHFARLGWEPGDIERELGDIYNAVPLEEIATAVASALREVQEQQIQTAHDESQYDLVSQQH